MWKMASKITRNKIKRQKKDLLDRTPNPNSPGRPPKASNPNRALRRPAPKQQQEHNNRLIIIAHPSNNNPRGLAAPNIQGQPH